MTSLSQRLSRLLAPTLGLLLAGGTLTSLVSLAPAVQAQDSLTAREIIDQAADSRSIDNSVQQMRLTSVLPNGRERVREAEVKVRSYQVDGEDRVDSLLRFTAPADMDGVQFLSVQDADEQTSQWLFYPPEGGSPAVLNRIVGQRQKRSRFLGTDFTFEDLELGGADDANYTRLADTSFEFEGAARDCYVIQAEPAEGGSSQYTRVVSVIDKADLLPYRVDFFDGDEQIKRMTITAFTREGERVIPRQTVMEDLKRNTRTVMELIEVRLDVPADELPAEMFTPAWLEQEG